MESSSSSRKRRSDDRVDNAIDEESDTMAEVHKKIKREGEEDEKTLKPSTSSSEEGEAKVVSTAPPHHALSTVTIDSQLRGSSEWSTFNVWRGLCCKRVDRVSVRLFPSYF